MESEKNDKANNSSGIDLPLQFISQAGLLVDTSENVWCLASHGKGHQINVSWLHSFNNSFLLRDSLLDSLIHFSQTNSASTVQTKVFALKKAFPCDNDSIHDFKARWQTFKGPLKKTLKGLLSNSVKLGHKNLNQFNDITIKYSYKSNFQALHPTKGRLTDYEYDSILNNLRLKCNNLSFVIPENLKFYTEIYSSNINKFINYRSIICYRMLIQIARRPKQISYLKWCDILPVGVSFNDSYIDSEPLFTGINELHLRMFKVKQTKSENSFRAFPERWSIPLSDSFSKLIIQYKKVYIKGISLVFEKQNLKLTENELNIFINNIPIFPNLDIFSADYNNQTLMQAVLRDNSTLFHISEDTVRNTQNAYGKGSSERCSSVIGTNNRLRHTWLSNAALRGLPITDISKITNVTLPAARLYLQMGLKERVFIDENYRANTFLKKAFEPKQMANLDDELIEDASIGPVGIEKKTPTCNLCDNKKRMVRPIACYGCTNFIPLLEANHDAVLQQALAKQEFILNFGDHDSIGGSIERLQKAICYIKLTISICNETLGKYRELSQNKTKK
jgi:hypothetical protein